MHGKLLYFPTPSQDEGLTHSLVSGKVLAMLRLCCLKPVHAQKPHKTLCLFRRGWVYALKRDFPTLDFSLNGVVDSCQEAAAVNELHCEGAQTHGVMIGRAAYHYPWQCLSDADRSVFGTDNHASSRSQVSYHHASFTEPQYIPSFSAKHSIRAIQWKQGKYLE